MTKEQRELWEAEKHAVRQLRDGMGMAVDRPIIDTVAVLRLLGFHTYMSCGGHIDRALGPSVSIASPHADEHRRRAHEAEKQGDREQARRAWQMVERHNAVELRRLVLLLARFYDGREVPHDHRLVAQGFGRLRYDLGSHSRDLLRVVPRNQRRALLDKQRQELRDFTDFLKVERFSAPR
ncbi:hypothetical protein [Streptomyces sp. AC555_RSS877]|uniref:hypothetical protein n=1 Tax=Streptomyces sp. AC555_RSS877 TaxID=2823688 RepID=UPI001C25BE93|nr:hypothetical protein [Streptomyces sp. AC555_RSS877]